MGAALATHRVDSARTPSSWPLLRTYLGYSMRSLSECASIFLGRSAHDSDLNLDHDHDATYGTYGTKRHSSSGYLPSAYPRYLTLEQFEEVFGLLVADAAPHFAFFQHAGNAVCAHHVFCSLALLARVDLHTKVQFILRLYATDAHGQLPTERRRLLLRDVLAAVPRVFWLAEPIENHVVSYLEKELLARDDASLASCRELYDFCFTTARISGFLHEIQSVVSDLALLRDKETNVLPAPTGSSGDQAAGGNAGNGRLKLLNRGATMLQLPHEALLWSLQARDFSWFWRQEHVVLSDATLVCDALRAMECQGRASAVVVVAAHSRTTYTGYLTLDDFLAYFVELLPEDPSATLSMGEYMRTQVAKAGQTFAHTSLRVVLASVHDTPTSSRGSAARPGVGGSKHQCATDAECFFNVILRLACGAQAVAVLAATAPNVDVKPSGLLPGDATWIDPLLGRISVFDILEWLCEDLSLLNGKERFAVAAFPWFYYTPTTLVVPPESPESNSRRPWLLDAVVAMQTQRTTGVLLSSGGERVLSPSTPSFWVTSAESLRVVFAAGLSTSNDSAADLSTSRFDALTPLHVLLANAPDALEPACFVHGGDSLAHVIHTMVATHARRVFIRVPLSDNIQGAIRATDILRLLLQEQHRQPRAA